MIGDPGFAAGAVAESLRGWGIAIVIILVLALVGLGALINWIFY